MEPKYLEIARRDVGVKETKGPQTNARVSQWLKRLRAWWADDETPWCGVALAGWMAEAGLEYPKEYYRALAWRNYGSNSGPRLGAVAVLTRKGGGHVGIVTGITETGDHVRLLGGNQGDMVRESWFPIDRVDSFRAPPGVTLGNCPICKVGELSSSEA